MDQHMSRRSRWRRGRDERGATFVLTAICMVLLLWGGAMGVDIGFTVSSSRQAQALADTAALDLARYINLADNVNGATNYNNYLNGKLANIQSDNNASNVTFTVTGMYWSSTAPIGWTIPNTAAGQGCYRQIPARNPACTAVLVTAKQNVPRIFAGGSASVTRTSMAAVTPEDGFSVGSYLASLNSQQSGVLNAILGTLGTSVNLTAASYQGLANSYVTVQQLITASAGALTPSNILTASLPASSWLSFFTTAIDAQQSATNCSATPEPSVCVADPVLHSLSFGGSSVSLCQLVTINGPTCGSSLSEAGLSASLNVLQTMTTEAELANGTNAINIQSALGITGVTAATLSLQVVSPPQIAYGPVGAKATSAQVNGDLQLSGPSLGGILNIPVIGAQGTGTLNAVTCSESNNTFGQAGITASSTTAAAGVTLGGASIGTLTMTGASSTSLPFGATHVPPSASTMSNNSNPTAFGTTTPNLSFSGSGLTGLVASLLTTTGVAPNTSPPLLQSVLGPVLQAAGVNVGGAVVADLNYNCGAVSIVQ
jgi:uncharacterized membrane protein